MDERLLSPTQRWLATSANAASYYAGLQRRLSKYQVARLRKARGEGGKQRSPQDRIEILNAVLPIGGVIADLSLAVARASHQASGGTGQLEFVKLTAIDEVVANDPLVGSRIHTLRTRAPRSNLKRAMLTLALRMGHNPNLSNERRILITGSRTVLKVARDSSLPRVEPVLRLPTERELFCSALFEVAKATAINLEQHQAPQRNDVAACAAVAFATYSSGVVYDITPQDLRSLSTSIKENDVLRFVGVLSKVPTRTLQQIERRENKTRSGRNIFKRVAEAFSPNVGAGGSPGKVAARVRASWPGPGPRTLAAAGK